MKFEQDELTKLKIINLQLVNFILGISIVSAVFYLIWRVGQFIFN